MLEKLERALSQLNISKKDNPCLVGVSAGPDSVALAHAMSRLGYQFVVAHFNHMIRAEALSDANYVEEFANSIGMPYFYGEGSVPEHAKAHSFSIEEAARELRYQFLFSIAQKLKAPAIIVAHTANDQVETVLMHLLRGAG
ncbi:MAG: tRNA lysidine(34) synthetase TilS, partial [Chloroflexota bacterium]